MDRMQSSDAPIASVTADEVVSRPTEPTPLAETGVAETTAESALIDGWLPPSSQILDALQLRINEPDGWAESQISVAERDTITLRQGMAMVILFAVIAGLLPFFANWIFASRVGTALPLASLTRFAEQQTFFSFGSPNGREILAETVNTMAGIESVFPGWVAAGLSALGEWINWPIRWLTAWLVYGLLVLWTSKIFGATTTLDRFYAITSYAAAPLLLLALSPVPFLGLVLSLVAYIWSATIYIWAVRTITGLDIGPALICALLPAAAISLLGVIVVGMAFGAVAGLAF